MKYALIALGVIVAIALLTVAIGMMLPLRHRASRQASYHQSTADIYNLISTPAAFPLWRKSVTRVEILPEGNGRPKFREIGKDGSILYEIERAIPNQTLITRIADPSLAFGGTWTYAISRTGDHTTLAITEDGEVYTPIFRFVSRFIIGHNSTIDQFLRDVGKRLGDENTVIIDGPA